MVIQTIKYSIFSTEFCNLKQSRNPSFIYTLLYIEVRLNTRIYLLRIPYFCVSSKPIVMAAEKKHSQFITFRWQTDREKNHSTKRLTQLNSHTICHSNRCRTLTKQSFNMHITVKHTTQHNTPKYTLSFK